MAWKRSFGVSEEGKCRNDVPASKFGFPDVWVKAMPGSPYITQGQWNSWRSCGSITCGHSIEGRCSRLYPCVLPVTGLKTL